MPRFRIRTLMIVIIAAAILLGVIANIDSLWPRTPDAVMTTTLTVRKASPAPAPPPTPTPAR
jgi:hypothetical protein